ncbi:arginine repressor [Deinococcus maricopensis]|uniref:Arginine repressor n=1 Tax=Deinococcus maricopensis (strain DSM 21211 / LMG 22137 / NRRL B-23946 / LB-34) TaxID=709986 RepID=E8UC73_DEIML|nr:arginine repressor [Deinococcus maricopensis]ADV68734.1 arginine repressor, ArgR [Deinococcus maricopensis DSM 21211]
MFSKEQRQKRIQEIIARESISTQSELVERLNAEGVRVTQATVSRDINELRLVRLPIGKSKHRYSLAQVTTETDVMDELARLFRTFVTDIDRGENLLVVKTAEGHANGVAFFLDKLRRDDIVGTLAGQDTIMIVARTVAEGEALLEELHSLMLG